MSRISELSLAELPKRDTSRGEDGAVEIWRLLTTWEADPGFNMGLDEALLERADTPPTLRLYSWRPDTLSLGYFQRFADVAGIDRAGCVVRRITGGGAIHHARELTFSIVVPREHALYRGPVIESYSRVHAAIVAALASVGIEAELRGDRPLASDRPGTGMCFHVSTPLDVAWEGRKGVGSAQRRRGGRILHHGSIKLGASELEQGIATVAAAEADERGAREELAAALVGGFRRACGLAFRDADPTREERAEGLARGQRYSSEAFVRRM